MQFMSRDRMSLFAAVRLTLAAFNKHNASRFGAALAFYIVFSLAPTLVIAIAMAGLAIGKQQAEREVLERIAGSFGTAAGSAIAAMIKDVPRNAGWLATGLGLMTLYFGLSGVYRQIDDALRTIWHEDHEEATASKIASMLLVVVLGVVVFISVLTDTAIATIGKYAGDRLIGGELLWHSAELLLSTVVLTALFAAVFRYLPHAKLKWRDVRVGAAVTAVLFVIGKFGLGIYLGKAAVGSAFGAAGSIVVVLLWAYWSAQILFFGLELTHVYAKGHAHIGRDTA